MKVILLIGIFGVLISLVLGGLVNRFEKKIEKREQLLNSKNTLANSPPSGSSDRLKFQVFILKFLKSFF